MFVFYIPKFTSKYISDKTLKFMKRGCVHKSSQFIKTCNTDRCNGHAFNFD